MRTRYGYRRELWSFVFWLLLTACVTVNYWNWLKP